MKLGNLLNVVIALLVFFVSKNLLQKFGLIGDAEGNKDDAELGADSKIDAFAILFDPHRIYKIFNESTAEKKNLMFNTFTDRVEIYEGMVESILSFPKIINDNEELLFSALKNIGSLEELAWFVEFYYKWVRDHYIQVFFWYAESADAIKVLGDFISEYLEPSEVTRLKTELSSLKYKFK